MTPPAANDPAARISHGAIRSGPIAIAPSSAPLAIHGTQPDQRLSGGMRGAMSVAATATAATSMASQSGMAEAANGPSNTMVVSAMALPKRERRRGLANRMGSSCVRQRATRSIVILRSGASVVLRRKESSQRAGRPTDRKPERRTRRRRGVPAERAELERTDPGSRAAKVGDQDA